MIRSHVGSLVTPWDDPSGSAAVTRILGGAGGGAVGLLQAENPRLDEFLMCDGLVESSLVAWARGGGRRDPVFQSAVRHGRGEGMASESGLRLARAAAADSPHVLWVAVPEALDGRQRWCGVFLKGDGAFTPSEREALEQLMLLWKAKFNNPDERGLSYAIVGSDQRLIHSDPACRLEFLSAGIEARAVIAELSAVRSQRWPTDEGDRAHDAALMIGSQPTWVCFRSSRAVADKDARFQVIELRPLEADELPAVGVLEDPRVAEALGYLHDRFDKGPTLTHLAELVDVSPFHFHRVFTKHVGVSPKQYQLMKQLQVARWRLRCGREAIGSIAESVGFANHAHFTSTFRRLLGVSPTEYQRRFSAWPCVMAEAPRG